MKRLAWKTCGLVIVLGSTSSAQVTQRVSVCSISVESGGEEGYGYSNNPSITPDGRYVAFESSAPNLDAGDSNNALDIFVRDRRIGTIERVSLASDGTQSNSYGHSHMPSISDDGRFVAFSSYATNFVPGDTNLCLDVFVRDRQSGTTERVSVDTGGAEGNASSSGFSPPSISADGRYVAFESRATNLVPGDANGFADVFVRDRESGTIELVSVDSGGAQGNGFSCSPSISPDGRYVAFVSNAATLVPGDTNTNTDVFVRDRLSGTMEQVSVGLAGQTGWETSFYTPSITPDGRHVAFDWSVCDACRREIYVRDRQTGTTELASVDSNGVPGYDESGHPSISSDGRYVSFHSYANTLVPEDTNGTVDIFVRDRLSGTTERVSLASGGTQGNGLSAVPSISADGRYVVYRSDATNLVPGDTNIFWDVFVHDREHEGYASLCDPGVSGVIGCPCSNPPSGPERGCDNSAATGGASLTASGGGYLSSDSLCFTTSEEKPSALSIVVQGTSTLLAGAIYGQGVRCIRGSLKRLYTKVASGGSITAPDFLAGDPMVHARSEAVGDPILPSSRRWYTVFYRDPIVLGGCSASSTLNTTQTRQVSWLP